MHDIKIYFTASIISEDNANSSGTSNHIIMQPMKQANTIAYSVELTEFKIEKGTKPTTWTPAPEDIQSEMEGLVVKSWTEYNINTSTQTAPAEGDGKWTTGLSTANIGKGQYL